MMIAYKLFRTRKDGTIGSLFINAKAKIPQEKWLRANCHPRTGFAVRTGWHCLPRPIAPHLTTKGRAWFKVEVSGVTKLQRPHGQGTVWYIARRMRVLCKVK